MAVNAVYEATEPVKVTPEKTDNPFESCVKATRLIYSEIPNQDAFEFKSNGTLENGEVLLMRYKTKNSDEYTYHIAPYKLVSTSTVHIYSEGNFISGKETERDLPIDDESIIGVYDYDLLLKFKKLPQSAQDVIMCESHFQHYEKDSSVLRGDSGKSYGIAQIQRKTWNWFNELRAKQDLPKLYDILDPFQQIEMVSWAWNNGMQNHWTCYSNIAE